jgi:hypothetical protein
MSTITRYNPAFVEIARTLAGRGALDRDLATAFGVHLKTLQDWKQRHPDFGEAVRMGKDTADDAVEHALFRRATGYSFESERVFCRDGVVTRVETVEHIPPSDRAAIFWLAARKPSRWGELPPPQPRVWGLGGLDPAQDALMMKAERACWRAREGKPPKDGDDEDIVPKTQDACEGDPAADLDTLLFLEGGAVDRDPPPDADPPPVSTAPPRRAIAVLPGLPQADGGLSARGSKYDPAFAGAARDLAERGALDRDLARAFGIHLKTLEQWRLRHTAFGEAVRRGKAVADDAVEQALFRKATGYSHVRERIFLHGEAVIRCEIVEHFPPSERAAGFWLSRRRPRVWGPQIQDPPDPAIVAEAVAESWQRIAHYNAERRFHREHGPERISGKYQPPKADG